MCFLTCKLLLGPENVLKWEGAGGVPGLGFLKRFLFLKLFYLMKNLRASYYYTEIHKKTEEKD